jgi:predicted porin
VYVGPLAAPDHSNNLIPTTEENRMKTGMQVAAATLVATLFAGGAAAQSNEELKSQIDSLQRQIDQLKGMLERQAAPAPSASAAVPGPGAGPVAKPGNNLTWYVGGGEVTLYGHVDVSLDDQTSGLAGFLNNGQPVTGKNGWVPDVSSNLSYFGVRGMRPVGSDLAAVFQFETEVAFAATTGVSDQAPDTTANKFSLGSRNSYIGLRGKQWGTVYLGKTDTPYKTASARLDPFASTPGDYNAIIGNSGGDNRAEFDARLPHSVWYQSPRIGGFNFGFLVSPGQNRSTDTGLYAMGEPDCAGGNSTAGLNGDNGQPTVCEDGSFGDAYSTAVTYQSGPLYALAGYELHKNVNRRGDEIVPGTIGIRDEMAYKAGVQYTLPSHTTLNFLIERLKRNAITAALDERTRTSTWFAVTQHLTPLDDLNFGWAHAGRTPGQPDQAIQDRTGTLNGPGPSDNSANLLSIGYKHRFIDNRTTWYATYSHLKNDHWAHYSLGAGGHGLPTRNYVGDKFNGGCQDGENCGPPFTGNTAQAVSVGMTYNY